MKRWLTLVILAVAAGGAQGVTVLDYGDNFNDGAMNTNLWDSFYNKSHLVEMNGRLYPDSDYPDTLEYDNWIFKSKLVMRPGDSIQVQATVNMPQLDIGTSPSAWASLKIGLINAISTKETFLEIKQANTGGREFLCYSFVSGGALTPKAYPVPAGISKFFLKIQYTVLTGKATYWVRESLQVPWRKLAVIKMNESWGVPVGNKIRLRPVVSFHATSTTGVSPDSKAYIDNFLVTKISAD